MTNEKAIKVIKALLLKIEPPTDTQLGWLETWVTKEDIKGLQSAIEALKREERWIPSNERPPEIDGEYFAIIYDTDENYKLMDIAEWKDGRWQYKDYVKVLAWMPPPEVYKSESVKK